MQFVFQYKAFWGERANIQADELVPFWIQHFLYWTGFVFCMTISPFRHITHPPSPRYFFYILSNLFYPISCILLWLLHFIITKYTYFTKYTMADACSIGIVSWVIIMGVQDFLLCTFIANTSHTIFFNCTLFYGHVGACRGMGCNSGYISMYLKQHFSYTRWISVTLFW